LGVTGEKRSPLFPQSLTAKESGYPTMVVDSWFGIFGPKGLPSDVQANLQRSCETVLNSAETVKKMEDQGATPTFENASRLQAILKSDLQVWKQVIQKAKVSLTEHARSAATVGCQTRLAPTCVKMCQNVTLKASTLDDN
jgi:tripartite-type tricarboxylate transporter receptor subunit TctC